MSLHVNQGGVWTEVSELHVNNGGSWVPVQKAFVNNGGSWVEYFSLLEPITIEIRSAQDVPVPEGYSLVDMIIVGAGGGGGGQGDPAFVTTNHGAGGGGGGQIIESLDVPVSGVISVTEIGIGGAPGTRYGEDGQAGGRTVADGIIALGGAGGLMGNAPPTGGSEYAKGGDGADNDAGLDGTDGENTAYANGGSGGILDNSGGTPICGGGGGGAGYGVGSDGKGTGNSDSPALDGGGGGGASGVHQTSVSGWHGANGIVVLTFHNLTGG